MIHKSLFQKALCWWILVMSPYSVFSQRIETEQVIFQNDIEAVSNVVVQGNIVFTNATTVTQDWTRIDIRIADSSETNNPTTKAELNAMGAGTSNYIDSVGNAVGLGGTNLAYAIGAGSTNLYTDPHQVYSYDLIVGDGGTATITYAMGSLIKFTATNTPVTITFSTNDYPTNGVTRVGVEIWANTNSIAFDSATITNATAPSFETNKWGSLFFRRTGGETLWKGRN